MSLSFPRVSGRKRGYRVAEVDRFLKAARIAFDGVDDRIVLTAAEIRTTSFRVRRKGYSIPHVDSALERLEEAFALREREGFQDAAGADEWLGDARARAQILLDRLTLGNGERFRRSVRFKRSYSVRDVDALARRISDYFQGVRRLTVTDVRTASFQVQRGGYRVDEVDAILDEVVAVMLAVR